MVLCPIVTLSIGRFFASLRMTWGEGLRTTLCLIVTLDAHSVTLSAHFVTLSAHSVTLSEAKGLAAL